MGVRRSLRSRRRAFSQFRARALHSSADWNFLSSPLRNPPPGGLLQSLTLS